MPSFRLTWRLMLIVMLPAIGLTAVFWGPLWRGGGFIGGDVYSYYLPQKQFLAEWLGQGDIPLWNNRGGHGYPIAGESQTGLFYPLHLLLYATLPLQTAYNVNHLLHYVFAFAFAFLFARRLSLAPGACGLAALVYTYAWFPARSCWEWAVLSGAYLPLILWCAESYLQTSRWRYLFALALALGLQLLAGHFNLSFFTLLLLVGYSIFRIIFARVSVRVLEDEIGEARHALPEKRAGHRPADSRSSKSQMSPPPGAAARQLALLAAAVVCGVLLAAVQLLPTWELKQVSQRRVTGVHHDLRFGSIPANAYSQILGWTRTDEGQFLPWASMLNPRDARLAGHGFRTNQVEAQLSCGLFPLGLAIGAVLHGLRRRRSSELFWAVIAIVSLVYTSGMLTRWLGELPGFSYFQGPGRMGIVFVLAVAVLAGHAWDALAGSRSGIRWLLATLVLLSLLQVTHLGGETADVASSLQLTSPLALWGVTLSGGFWTATALGGLTVGLVAGCAAAGRTSRAGNARNRRDIPQLALSVLLGLGAFVTVAEYWMTSRLITYSTMLSAPPISRLSESPLHRQLSVISPPARVLGPGGNLLNMTGAASTPVYLTFGPAAYVESSIVTPMSPDGAPLDLADVSVTWMRRTGVTHVVSLEPRTSDGLELVWAGFDPCFSVALNHRMRDMYLYRVTDAPGRIAWYGRSAPASAAGRPPRTLEIREFSPDRIECRVHTRESGFLEFRELDFPGWTCELNGQPVRQGLVSGEQASAASALAEAPFRRVELNPGDHHVVWKYEPWPLYWGAVISISTLLLLMMMTALRYRYRFRGT